MVEVLIFLLLIVVAVLGIFFVAIYKKNIHIWLIDYIARKVEPPVRGEPIHIMFAFVDHYEPGWGNPTYEKEVERVDEWCDRYPQLARNHKDADGYLPKHTFFFPEEEYREEHLEKLCKLCSNGFGEIEIHLHHDNDTADGLKGKITGFLETLDQKHGAIPRDKETTDFRFAFIHGNWALDNSRRDGRWCGVNNELAVLADLGCYADFTLPSAPSDTQTSKVNSIYYAKGENGKSKSHNYGIDVEVGRPASGDLMIIQGPLCLNWKQRKFGIFPRIENSDIRENSPPSQQRVDMWIKCGIQVKKQPQWRFVKIHTHGTQDHDMDTVLGKSVDEMFGYLESNYNDGQNYILHYVSAREMYNIIVAAESGETGDAGQYRDFKIPKPVYL